MYEITSLQKTFDGTNLPALINKIVKVKYAPIRNMCISDNLRQLITDLLQKDPDRRPYAYEVLDTVADLVHKTQCDKFANIAAERIQYELFSGCITNGYGIGLGHQQQ